MSHFYIRNATDQEVTVSDSSLYFTLAPNENMYDLLLYFSPEQIRRSSDLQDKINNGVIVRQDEEGQDIPAEHAYDDLEYCLLTEGQKQALDNSTATPTNPVATIADVTAAAYGIKGAVDYYSDLPTDADTGEIYIVRNSDESGHEEGFYRKDDEGWTFLSRNTGAQDHGELDGLLDDDHPQYFNEARGDVRYFPRSVLESSDGAGFIGIADVNDYYDGTTVEAALQEAGKVTHRLRVGKTKLFMRLNDSDLWVSVDRHRVMFNTPRHRYGPLMLGVTRTGRSGYYLPFKGYVLGAGISIRLNNNDGNVKLYISENLITEIKVPAGEGVNFWQDIGVITSEGYLTAEGNFPSWAFDIVMWVEVAELMS